MLTCDVRESRGPARRWRLAPWSVLAGATMAALAGPAAASAQAEAEPVLPGPRLERDALVQAVLDRNPTLQAARHAWQAAFERIPQATSLDDPTLSYSFAPLSVASGDARYGQVARLAQRLPFPGTLRLRGEVACAEAEAARYGVDAARLSLAYIAALLFADYYYVERSVEINEEHVSLLEGFKRIATARYAAGVAAQQDPLQAEVELAHLIHRRVVLAADHDVLVAQINALLHRRPEAPLPPAPATLRRPGPGGDADPAALQEEAVRRRPELGAAAAEIEAREAAVDLRELGFRPGFEVMSSYNSMWGTGDHRWMVGLGIRLPLRRSRIRASVAEAEARLDQARSERERLEDEVRSEAQQAHARIGEARHVVELHVSRLLPAARDQVQAALSGFRAGRNSFLAVIEAERNQRTTRLGLEAALADHDRARARLDRALGRIPGAPPEQEAKPTEGRLP